MDYKKVLIILLILSVTQCNKTKSMNTHHSKETEKSYYGTLLPFASESVYFLITDRFDDGDPSNNFPNQGGVNKTFDRTLDGGNGKHANVGYLGGDFKGILNHADYISDMGFTAIWLSPVVDNPNESFTGGELIEYGGQFKDGGKTGYHGYWGVNFFNIDEHWPSTNLSFKQLTTQLREKHGIKTVLDIVLNHGSPAFSMTPVDQPMFGEIYDENNRLVADHQNLPAEQLDESNPLHQFYNHKTEILQLSDINENNPQVLEYFVKAYLYWIDEGADAFRIDTLKHMPNNFWKKFADRIKAKHPNLFMFGESYSFDVNFIAKHTLPKNGEISVLDFPGQKAITAIFENPSVDYSKIKDYLYLSDSPYHNAYELMTFYDNHDMQRMDADDNGFIDAHNWLFTSRGIPVVYYGSEVAFMAGTKEHMGNRNYYGKENIEKAKLHKIQKSLSRIANIRKQNISLQKGLQINLEFAKHQAAFYRVYEFEGENQTALVLLNKASTPHQFNISDYLSTGIWINAADGKIISISQTGTLNATVEAHGVSVLILNQKNTNLELIQIMDILMGSNN